MTPSLFRRGVAEAVGTAFLLASVVGSGIMGERLAGANVGLALLANTIATGAALLVLILTFRQISGAHFNPAVTLSFLSRSELNWRDGMIYIGAQFAGAVAGVVAANLMFSEPPIFLSGRARRGAAQIFSEFIATFGLVLIIRICAKLQPRLIAFAVAAYITSAYWFTSSTSVANPAVTFARSLSDTFAGIRPIDVPAFVVAELSGAVLATLLAGWFTVVSPREESS